MIREVRLRGERAMRSTVGGAPGLSRRPALRLPSDRTGRGADVGLTIGRGARRRVHPPLRGLPEVRARGSVAAWDLPLGLGDGTGGPFDLGAQELPVEGGVLTIGAGLGGPT